MTGELYVSTAYLDEVQDLACRLLDQIQWVALANYDEHGQPFAVMDDRWAREASKQVTRQNVRDGLKRVMQQTIERVKGTYEGRMMIDRESVPAAARLIVWAIKQLFLQMDQRNHWLLKRQLVIQFSSIYDPDTLRPIPWVEDLWRPQKLVIE